MKVTAQHLLDLLEARHSSDVFVAECKTGQSYGTGLLKLDAWAMKRSWSKPWSFGYEIKVSRSDFLRDDKWPAYLDYCTDFYFVAPAGLIHPSEVGEQSGLICASKNAKKLYVKKRAPRRQLVVPEDLYRYILMCRTKVGREHSGETNAEYWRRWLQTKKENRETGGRVRWQIAEMIIRAKAKADEAAKRIETVKQREELVSRVASRLGIQWFWGEDDVEKRLSALRSGYPDPMIDKVRSAVSALNALLDEGEETDDQD